MLDRTYIFSPQSQATIGTARALMDDVIVQYDNLVDQANRCQEQLYTLRDIQNQSRKIMVDNNWNGNDIRANEHAIQQIQNHSANGLEALENTLKSIQRSKRALQTRLEALIPTLDELTEETPKASINGDPDTRKCPTEWPKNWS